MEKPTWKKPERVRTCLNRYWRCLVVGGDICHLGNTQTRDHAVRTMTRRDLSFILGNFHGFDMTNSHVVFYNKRTLQNVVGPMCGYYSAYHLLQASRGKTLEQIINAFDEADPVKNDDKVQSYLHQYVNRFS